LIHKLIGIFQHKRQLLYGGNSKVVNGVAILGYYNSNPTTLAAYTSDAGNQPTDKRFGKAASLKMNNVLEIGKTYRLQFDVIKHGGYTAGGTEASPFSGTPKSITINNTPSGLVGRVEVVISELLMENMWTLLGLQLGQLLSYYNIKYNIIAQL
jgi:hypothetical protein